MQNKKDKGFTLVELLIVIVILGILATITVFAVRGITDQGQKSACNTDQKTLQTAVEAYYAQYGTAANPTRSRHPAPRRLVSTSSTTTPRSSRPLVSSRRWPPRDVRRGSRPLRQARLVPMISSQPDR